MTQLHPLHTPEFVARYIITEGQYPGLRCTGRSTAQALRYLAASIEQPGVAVVPADHHGTVLADRLLLSRMAQLSSMMGLKHMDFRATSVTFRKAS
jgi:hypothetical protein